MHKEEGRFPRQGSAANMAHEAPRLRSVALLRTFATFFTTHAHCVRPSLLWAAIMLRLVGITAIVAFLAVWTTWLTPRWHLLSTADRWYSRAAIVVLVWCAITLARQLRRREG